VSILLVNADQLLVRPIELYEFPYPNILRLDSQTNFDDKSIFKLESKALYFIKIKSEYQRHKNLNLISNLLVFKTNKSLNNNISIKLVNNHRKMQLISK
jgi:putative salt-induced outer membrane protein YdiY